jgi:hypothetical protein
MMLYIVVGGDRMHNRVDVIGIYSTFQEAEKAAHAAGAIVKDNEWFGCSISGIEVDTPVRNAWGLEKFNGWRRLPPKEQVCPVG